MTFEVLFSQIRSLTITDTGGLLGHSLTVPQSVLDEVGVSSYQAAYVHNIRTGAIERTVIIGGGDDRVIATGGMGRLFLKHDGVRINFFAMMTPEAAKDHKPIILETNKT